MKIIPWTFIFLNQRLTHINQLQDLGQLREIRDKSKMIMNVSQTRIKNLVVKVA